MNPPDPPSLHSGTLVQGTCTDPPSLHSGTLQGTCTDPPSLHSGTLQGTCTDPPSLHSGTFQGTCTDPPSLHSGTLQGTRTDPPSLHSGTLQGTRTDPPSLHSGTSGLIIQQNRIQSQTEGETSNYQLTGDYINCTDSHQTAPNYPELRYHQLFSRKRTERTSPFSSPLKQTRSPLRKLRRMRTGMEQCNTSTTHESSLSGMFNKTTSISHGTNDMSLADFHTNSQEISSYLEFQKEIHAYTFSKVVYAQKETPRYFYWYTRLLFHNTANLHTKVKCEVPSYYRRYC